MSCVPGKFQSAHSQIGLQGPADLGCATLDSLGETLAFEKAARIIKTSRDVIYCEMAPQCIRPRNRKGLRRQARGNLNAGKRSLGKKNCLKQRSARSKQPASLLDQGIRTSDSRGSKKRGVNK